MKSLLLLTVAAAFPLFGQETALRPGDTVSIQVAGIPQRESVQISNTYSLDQRGFLKIYPLDTPISAQNLTPSELARRIELAYKSAEQYTHPIVSVKIDAGDPTAPTRFVMVGGEVNKTGKVPFTSGMTLWDAIQQAGGVATFGDPKKVRIQRKLGNGQRTEMTYDIRRVTPETDPLLAPDDQIIVPK